MSKQFKRRSNYSTDNFIPVNNEVEETQPNDFSAEVVSKEESEPKQQELEETANVIPTRVPSAEDVNKQELERRRRRLLGF